MTEPTRWQTDTDTGHSDWYAKHFRTLREQGNDLDGEARFMDVLLPRHARVLDAGCGQGRTGGALMARGHEVVGVDADPVLIAAAEIDNPGPTWILADLSTLDLHADHPPFDAAVLAGNVMSFVAPGTEARVLERIASHLTDDGLLVTGFHLEMCDLATFDAAVDQAGLHRRQRFATWDLEPWPNDKSPADAHSAGDSSDSEKSSVDFCVTVLVKQRA